MKKIFLVLTILSVGIWSCTRDEIFDSSNPVGDTKTVTLTVNADQLSRVGHTDDETVEVLWSAGDQLLVVEPTSGNKALFTLSEGAGTSLGIFTGTVPSSTLLLDVYYPADIDTNPINYALQTQSGDASMAHFAQNDLMYVRGVGITEANTASATLSHAGIIFTIPIANNTEAAQNIVGVTIADRKAYEEINFSGSVLLENNAFRDTKAASIDLIYPIAVASGATTTANVVVYLTDYASLAATDKIDIFVHTRDGRYMTTKTGVAMSPGTRYTISGVAMNANNFQSDLSLLGDAFETISDWTPTGKLPATNNQNGTYTWSGPLFENSSFRFSNIGETWGSQTFEILNSGGPIAVNAHPDDGVVPQFSITEEGLYNVEVNFNTMQATLTKTAAYRFIYPIGTATAYGWTPQAGTYMSTYAVENDEEIISGTITLIGGTAEEPAELKFLRRATFAYSNYQHIIPQGSSKNIVLNTTESFLEVVNPADPNDYKWLLPEGSGGEYTITINYTQKTILFERETPDGISLPAYRNGAF